MCEVLHKDTIKPEILPHSAVANMAMPQKGNLARVFQYIFHKLEAPFQWRIVRKK